MSKWFRSGLCIGLCTVLCLTGCATDTTPPEEITVPTGEDNEYTLIMKGNTDFQQIAQTDQLALYINGSTAEIAVENKQTGARWFSNPQNRDVDMLAQGEKKSLLNSQVAVTLSDDSDKFTTMYSWDEAVEYDQFRYAPLENGLAVTYEFGKRNREYLIPLLLEPEKMERIRNQLEESDIDTLNTIYELIDLSVVEDEFIRQQILDIYPALAEKPLYMVSNYTSEISEFVKEMVEEVLLKTDYTFEEMREDAERLQIIGISEQKNLLVNITVEYRLTEQGLSVHVPKESILYNSGVVKLTNISILPAFGAIEQDTADSYVFVPDGSGALLYGNGGNTNAADYKKQVYGFDRSTEQMELVNQSDVRLPVFGVKNGQEAFLAIITEGDSCAWLHAECAGKHDGYTKVYTDFAITPYVKPVYSTLNIWTINSYQSRANDTDLSISYRFLSGDDASYTGMANAYREHLLKQSTTSQASTVSLQLTLSGAVKYPDSVAGIRVNRQAALTTYSQAADLISRLRKQGVDDFRVVFKGGLNGGLFGDASAGADAMSVLGGTAELKNLIALAQNEGIPLAMDGELLYSTKGKLRGEVAQSINGYTAYAYRYRPHDGARSLEWTDYYVVSPVEYTAFAQEYAEEIAELGIKDSAVLSIGTALNSDYKKEQLTDRSQTQKILQEILFEASKSGQVTVSGGNAYALGAASAVTNAPLDTPMGYLFNEVVPFYAIATRGVAQVAGEPLNASSDMRYALLKAIETGSDIAVDWMYAENAVLKNTYYEGINLCYTSTMAVVCDAYAELQEAVGDCAGYGIISHAQVQPSVYRTVFANGVTVYVNYSDKAAVVDGYEIPARDWTREGTAHADTE